MSKLAIRFEPETVKTLAFGSIVAGYTAVGSAFTHPIRILMIQNLTDESVMFSFDGTNDHLPLSLGGYLLIDVTANKSLSQGFYVSEGETIYVKRIGVPTTGAVYVSAFYGSDGY